MIERLSKKPEPPPEPPPLVTKRTWVDAVLREANERVERLLERLRAQEPKERET